MTTNEEISARIGLMCVELAKDGQTNRIAAIEPLIAEHVADCLKADAREKVWVAMDAAKLALWPELVRSARNLETEILSRFGRYEDMSQELQVVMLDISKILAREEKLK